MSLNVGLWLDHKQAYVIWDGNKDITTIPSNLERRIHFSGGVRIAGTYNQGRDSELRHNDRYEHQLNQYYTKIIARIEEAESIFIFGPGEAKIELEKALEKHKSMRDKLLKVETADNMTNAQMVAHVRKFYEQSSEK